jgi:hypothetical protein
MEAKLKRFGRNEAPKKASCSTFAEAKLKWFERNKAPKRLGAQHSRKRTQHISAESDLDPHGARGARGQGKP